MWWKVARKTPDWSEAEAHLRKDPILAPIVDRIGPCRLSPRKDGFVVLCQSIFSQQISVAAANALFKRFKTHFPRGMPTAALALELTDEQMRSAGLSRQKIAYIRSLAQHVAEEKIVMRHFPKLTDEEAIAALTQVKGIGRWTAEMFLIFVLNRPDLLPVDDLGLLRSVMNVYGLKKMPDKKKVLQLGEAWRPWRSIATWYLWHAQEQK